MRLTIDTAGPEAIAELAADLCPGDLAELAASGINVEQDLADVECQALRVDGRLVCLFGLAGHPDLEGGGIPWMLSTNALPLVPRRWVARTAREIVNDWRAERALLINMVHRRNRRAVRFIEWLGFDIDRTPAGPGGEFWVFQWRRHV